MSAASMRRVLTRAIASTSGLFADGLVPVDEGPPRLTRRSQASQICLSGLGQVLIEELGKTLRVRAGKACVSSSTILCNCPRHPRWLSSSRELIGQFPEAWTSGPSLPGQRRSLPLPQQVKGWKKPRDHVTCTHVSFTNRSHQS